MDGEKCAAVLAVTLVATVVVGYGVLKSLEGSKDKAENVIQDGGFEQSASSWNCKNCSPLSRSTESYSGTYSYHVISSESGKSTLNQNLSVNPGTRYVLEGHIKLEQLPMGAIFQRLELHVEYFRRPDLPHPPALVCQDGITQCHLIPNVCDDLTAARTICRKTCNICDNDLVFVGILPMVQPEIGWQEIGGDILIPDDVDKMNVYFTFYGKTGNFLVDDVSVTQLPTLVNWKNTANARIEKYRKADINIRIHGEDPKKHGLGIKLTQKSRSFPFGSAVTADGILNSSFTKYQDFFYNNFNWGVLENALKWQKTEKTQGVVDVDKPVRALQKLQERGKSVRGHTVFWDVAVWGVQPWVAMLNKDQLTQAMDVRYNIVNVTKGKVKHWDVNNENLHGDFYENKLQNANITMNMFRRVHSIDPDAHLFLNDFDIVLKSSQRTVAIKNQGKLFHASGVPIYGIGIQSHLRDGDVDITAMKHRLDKVAEAGLPMWITEFSYNQDDVMKRAEGYEDVLRLYFSHPAIEGILIWGYWDKMIFQVNASIATGPDVQPNEAGRRILNLLNNEWWTNQSLDLTSSQQTLRGFHGDYDLTVTKGGQTLRKETFTLPATGKTIDIYLNVTSGNNLDISNIAFG